MSHNEYLHAGIELANSDSVLDAANNVSLFNGPTRFRTQQGKVREQFDRWIVSLAVDDASEQSRKNDFTAGRIMIPGDEAVEVFVRIYNMQRAQEGLYNARASAQYTVLLQKWQKALLDAIWQTSPISGQRLGAV